MKSMFTVACLGAIFAATVSAQTKGHLELKESLNGMDVDFQDLLEQLKSKDDIQTLSRAITDKIQNHYLEMNESLPDVCASGQACRDEVFLAAKQQVRLDWEATLTTIAREFENAWFLSKQTLTASYSTAYDCKPGCYCEQIMTEYNEVFLLEEEMKIELTTLETELKGLYKQTTEIQTTCPEYHAVQLASGETQYLYNTAGTDSSNSGTILAQTGAESDKEWFSSDIMSQKPKDYVSRSMFAQTGAESDLFWNNSDSKPQLMRGRGNF